ncbi:hypothetical protein [uncultured Hoeflea sp.]|uniref:hypothetical protein n=1 Tax=uncultured Hoeflea sp. TaxID=538666 RepID=UPI002619B9B3|nr:hypothetical protein [uncultured Hoeflea sp.]
MKFAVVSTNTGLVVSQVSVDDGGTYEPGPGFIAVAVEDEPAYAGCSWTEDGGFVEPPKPVPSPEEFAALKEGLKASVIARADAFTAPVLSGYPEAERAGWPKREAEARAIIAASDKAAAIAETSVIKALAHAAGENTAATVARAETIAAKADEFAAISAAVEIMRDTALTAIDAVNDPADMPATLDALNAQATALAEQYGLA